MYRDCVIYQNNRAVKNICCTYIKTYILDSAIDTYANAYNVIFNIESKVLIDGELLWYSWMEIIKKSFCMEKII